MSLPEISRRCLSCGAAVRAGSRFCPQCGQGLEAEAHPGASGGLEGAPVPPTTELSLPPNVPPPTREPPPTNEWTPPAEWTPPTREFAAFEQSTGAAPAPAAPPPEPTPVAVAAALGPEPAGVGAPRSHEGAGPASAEAGEEVADAGRAGDLRGRVARVREGTRARVGRMREEAIVVLEETPDDPGLRFVLVAALLFVVFLVLLFLSTTVLR